MSHYIPHSSTFPNIHLHQHNIVNIINFTIQTKAWAAAGKASPTLYDKLEGNFIKGCLYSLDWATGLTFDF